MTEMITRLDATDRPGGAVPHGTGELVVVGEPEETLNATLCHLLSVTGYRALSAADALSLVEVLRGNLADLLIVDAMLPVTSGIGLCRDVRQQPLGRFLPIVVLGEQSLGQRLAALEAGADAFFGRPLDPRELLLVVRHLLDHRRVGNVIDPVSRLPTGQAARVLVEEALKQPAWAALLFELRGLRAVNRRLGYVEGDGLLAAMAGLLRELVVTTDDRAVLVRIAGSRFVAVVAPAAAADLYRQAIDGFRALVAEVNGLDGDAVSQQTVREPTLHLAVGWVVGGPAAPAYPALIDELADRAGSPDSFGQTGFPGCPPFRAES